MRVVIVLDVGEVWRNKLHVFWTCTKGVEVWKGILNTACRISSVVTFKWLDRKEVLRLK